MSGTVYLTKVNEVFLKVEGEPSALVEIHNYFTFDMPNASFHPLVRARKWDGKLRLLNLKNGLIFYGLKQKIINLCVERGYDVEVEQDDELFTFSEEQLKTYVDNLELRSKNKPIEVRKYQLEALHTILHNNRSLIVSPTGSGKSLIIYLAIRAYVKLGMKGVLIVPTQGLVEQMYNDFRDYSSSNSWDVSGNVQKLYSGFDKNFHSNVLVTTWQSLLNMPESFYKHFDFMIGDECHQWDSKSFNTIGKRLTKTKYRIGFTGTLEDSIPHEMTLEGIFGPIHYTEKTSELIEQGYLAQTEIKCLVFRHPADTSEIICKGTYQEEIQYLTQNEKRNRFISNLALSLDGNTLVLFNFVENQGLLLHEMLLQSDPSRIHLIHGEIETEQRETIRNIVNSSNNSILLASLGTFAVGQNIPNLHNAIFAHPSKSKIRNLQSIGRGLRIGDNKDSFTLYDIADDMRYKSEVNYTLKHFLERVKIYTNEKFNYNVYHLKF